MTGSKKEYWWVSIGGNSCEPAIVVREKGKLNCYTAGCPDPLDVNKVPCVVELVKEMPFVPPTPKEAKKAAARWEKQRERDRARGIVHGYRSF